MTDDDSKISRNDHCDSLEFGQFCLVLIPGRWLFTNPPVAPQLKVCLANPSSVEGLRASFVLSLVFGKGSLTKGAFDYIHLMYRRKLRFAQLVTLLDLRDAGYVTT